MVMFLSILSPDSPELNATALGMAAICSYCNVAHDHRVDKESTVACPCRKLPQIVKHVLFECPTRATKWQDASGRGKVRSLCVGTLRFLEETQAHLPFTWDADEPGSARLPYSSFFKCSSRVGSHDACHVNPVVRSLSGMLG
jgi:hypothetical protein